MKMKGADIWTGTTILAVAVSLLAISISHAQKPAGISRIGWLEVCGPGPRRPNLEIFPWPPGGTGLRGGEEPSYRAAIRRLLI
jgi:hypothetical protein